MTERREGTTHHRRGRHRGERRAGLVVRAGRRAHHSDERNEGTA